MNHPNKFPYHCYVSGDHACTFSFGDTIEVNINEYILQLFYQYQKHPLPGIRDCIPSYTTLTFVYDALFFLSRKKSPVDAIQQFVDELILSGITNEKKQSTNMVRIPVCYEANCGPDLSSFASIKKISVDELIQLHSSVTYRVYMNGFLPGFAYMGKVDEKIAAPRLSVPRQKVPAGSVGIAGDQTGIYPMESPGGWQLIGRTPLVLFHTHASKPCLLEPGNQVQFYPISFTEFEKWSAQ